MGGQKADEDDGEAESGVEARPGGRRTTAESGGRGRTAGGPQCPLGGQVEVGGRGEGGIGRTAEEDEDATPGDPRRTPRTPKVPQKDSRKVQ